mgnify:FL=1|tara:strand:- start:1009 stop:1242 length:234 start_codon:yes stop_codon:yes gene_type:complete
MKLLSYISFNFYKLMSEELLNFDIFVDDIISSEDNLLKGELDFLLMQHIFDSIELDNLKELDKDLNSEDYFNVFLAA